MNGARAPAPEDNNRAKKEERRRGRDGGSTTTRDREKRKVGCFGLHTCMGSWRANHFVWIPREVALIDDE